MSNFPKNSGNPIKRSKASQEEARYQEQYPGTAASFDFDLQQLLAHASDAAAKGASQYYFINGLDSRSNLTLAYGFISEDGQWVVKPSKLALRQSKAFSKAHPDRTQAYGWGITSLTAWLSAQAGADTATFKNAINDGGSDTLIVSTSSDSSALRTADPSGDEEDDFNDPVLCPPFCGGGVGG